MRKVFVPGPFTFRLARLIGRGEYDAAIAGLRDYLKGKPSDVHALQMTAYLYRRTGRSDEAIALCRLSLAHDPAMFDAHAMLAELLAEAGRYEEAAGHARKGLENYPEPIEVPRSVLLITRALYWVVPRLRSAEDHLRNPDAPNIDWFNWAKGYLIWYDETHGSNSTPPQH